MKNKKIAYEAINFFWLRNIIRATERLSSEVRLKMPTATYSSAPHTHLRAIKIADGILHRLRSLYKG